MISFQNTEGNQCKMDRSMALPCEIGQGGFSGYRSFQLQLPCISEKYFSSAPYRYCWDEDGHRLPTTPPQRGQFVSGQIAANVLEVYGERNRALVSIPDGERVEVDMAMLQVRPRM